MNLYLCLLNHKKQTLTGKIYNMNIYIRGEEYGAYRRNREESATPEIFNDG